jgi:Transcription initiation factor IID, 18kD subunit
VSGQSQDGGREACKVQAGDSAGRLEYPLSENFEFCTSPAGLLGSIGRKGAAHFNSGSLQLRGERYLTVVLQMMFVSGETAEPSPETTWMIEEIVREQVLEMVSICGALRFCANTFDS